ALEEEKRFRATLDRGLEILEDEFARMAAAGEKKVAGKAVFTLYDTYGFPDDLTEIIAGERGFTLDKIGFEDEMEKARERSRFSGSGEQTIGAVYKETATRVGGTKFLGYDTTVADGKILALVSNNERVQHAGPGMSVGIIVDQTPFYAESGGQIGD